MNSSETNSRARGNWRPAGFIFALAAGMALAQSAARGADDCEKDKAAATVKPMLILKAASTAASSEATSKAAATGTESSKAAAKSDDDMQKAMQDAQNAYEKQQRELKERLDKDPLWQPAYAQAAVIKPAAGQIESFCLNKDGNLLVCCGASPQTAVGTAMPMGITASNSGPGGTIAVISPEGKRLASWQVPMKPQAICMGGDGQVYVAGVGKLVKLDASGKVLLVADAPNVAELPPVPEIPKTEKKDDPAAAEAKQKKIAELRESMNEAMKEYSKVAAEAQKEIKPHDDESIEAYQEKVRVPMEKVQAVQAELAELTTTPQQRAMQMRMQRERMSTITGMAVTERDLFVACAASKGYGYVVWRVDRDFAHPKRIVQNLAGCCGQMDIQARGGDLWVAHNSRHKVEHYSREGKKLSSFGKTDRINADGFGGCCEPKNVRFGAGDIVFACESGPPTCVKRYTTAGKFLGVELVAPWNSGCVRVTTEYDAAKDRFFVLNSGEQSIHIFTKKPAAKAVPTTSAPTSGSAN